MDFKNGVINMQAAGYNGTGMVEAHCGTGKSFSEALVLTSTNPQYDKNLPVTVILWELKELFREG